ncbi:hypothetical protein L208DRAFT_1343549, partial [Tricholoma matsutake]
CIFCGLSGHFISDCLVCQMYINEQKCKKNAKGKVMLPNGQFTPRNIPGCCIKDHIDEWIRRNPDINIIPALMGIYQIMDMNTAADIHITHLEQELYALQSGRNFAQHEPGPIAAPVVQPSILSMAPSAEPVALPTPTIAPPSISSTVTNPSTSNIAPATALQTTLNLQPTPNLQPLMSLQPPVHPYAAASENTYLPPHEQNFASTSKGKECDGPSYHTVAPIQNDTIAQDIFSRSMKILIVTLTMEELLSLSPKVHMKWKEQLTPHRILNQDGNNVGHLVNEEVLMINDPYETYISSLQISDIPKPFVAAKESHSIRSVMMNVNSINPVQSVVDPGSSIIAMSEEVCHELCLAYNPSIHIPLQSANGGIDKSLGLARNVPCKVGMITIYMQIYIIRNPAYDILLG